MAQLPPKIPINTISPNWHGGGFGHHHKPPPPMPMPPSSFHNSNPWWVDEFLDFSSARRGSRRRSASDSVAFLEPDESHLHDLDRLDEDKLIMSMFSDVVVDVQPPALSSSTSTPTSDHNSINEEEEEEKVAATEEDQAQSEYCKTTETQQPTEPVIVDPKRVKRILANRKSAQRSRVRKLQYISELERSVTTLQTEVSALSPRVAFLDHQRSVLTFGNSHLKLRIAALVQDKIFKDAHLEALKKEMDSRDCGKFTTTSRASTRIWFLPTPTTLRSSHRPRKSCSSHDTCTHSLQTECMMKQASQ